MIPDGTQRDVVPTSAESDSAPCTAAALEASVPRDIDSSNGATTPRLRLGMGHAVWGFVVLIGIAILIVLWPKHRATCVHDSDSRDPYLRCLGAEECRRERKYAECRGNDDGCNGQRNGGTATQVCSELWERERTNMALECADGKYIVLERGEYVFAVSGFESQWDSKVSVSAVADVPREDHPPSVELHPENILIYPPTYWHWRLEAGDKISVYTKDKGRGGSGALVPVCTVDGRRTSEASFRDDHFHIEFRVYKAPGD